MRNILVLILIILLGQSLIGDSQAKGWFLKKVKDKKEQAKVDLAKDQQNKIDEALKVEKEIKDSRIKEEKLAQKAKILLKQQEELGKQEVKLVVEFKSPLGGDQLRTFKENNNILKMQLLTKHNSDYFKRTYKVETLGREKAVIESLKALDNVIEVETITGVKLFNIFPQEDTLRPSNDPLIQYQWGHFNQKQIVLKEKDDIHNIRVEGLTGVDVGWKNIKDKLPSMMKKNIVVAVIDTGVDFSHPDLINNIALNKIECKDDRINLDPEAPDRDANGYPADCMGMDFTVNPDSVKARIPMDDQGHGTHVAGIISATIGNKKGISGFSNAIKILPIKVLSKANLAATMTDRLAAAIMYAVDRDVDVINMSLGWSKSLDKKYLRQAIATAIKKHIIIVVAAGNNSSNDTIYPCAYPNIICVGAITNDGKIASFSNHGGNVDVLAPGDSILSLTSRRVIPDFFSIKGYDIKSGTSQAAPYVAALAAILKGVYPEIKLNEVTARMTESAKAPPIDEERGKRFQHGLIQMDKAIAMEETYSLKPTFKVMTEVVYAAQRKKFSFRLPMKNYWKLAKNILIKVSTTTPGINFARDVYKVKEMETNQVLNIPIQGEIADLDGDSEFDLTVDVSVVERKVIGTTIDADGNEVQEFENTTIQLGSYNHKVPMARYIENDPELKILPVKFTGSKLPILNVKDGKLNLLIKKISDKYHQADMAQYYLKRVIKPKDEDDEDQRSGMEFFIFKKDAASYKQVETNIYIDQAINILNVGLVDINYDGKLDYFIRTINANEDESEYVQYSFFDEELKPLFGDKSSWTFFPEVTLDQLQIARYMPVQTKLYGKIALPVFVSEGELPQANQLTGVWDNRDTMIKNRLYYLEPEQTENGIELITKVIDDKKFTENLRENLNINWDSSVRVLSLFNQSNTDLQQGITRALISVGQGWDRQSYQIDLFSKDNYRVRKIEMGHTRLEERVLNTVINLDGETPDYYSADSFVGFYTKTVAEVTLLNKTTSEDSTSNFEKSFSQVYTHKGRTDHLLGFLSNYVKDNNFYSFFQSRNTLVMLVRAEDGETKVFSKPIIRFSFLPGSVFNELFSPIVTKESGKMTPALYVDGTDITANRVHVLSAREDKLISPIKYSVLVPRNCKIMHPTQIGELKAHAYTFACVNEQKDFEIKYLELK
jgi:cell wall-associated protease